MELVEQVEQNSGEKPSEVLADSGFSFYENLEYLEERNIERYIPDQRMESLRKGTCQHPNFREAGLDMMKARIVIFALWERFFPTRDY